MHLIRYGCLIIGGYAVYKWIRSYFTEDLMECSLMERVEEEELQVNELDKQLHDLENDEHSARKSIARYEDELKLVEKLDRINSEIAVVCSSCESNLLKMEVYRLKEYGIFIDDLIMKVNTTLSCDNLVCHSILYKTHRFNFYFDPSILHPLLETIVTTVLTHCSVIERNELINLKCIQGGLTNGNYAKSYELDLIQGMVYRNTPVTEVENRQLSISYNYDFVENYVFVHYLKRYSYDYENEIRDIKRNQVSRKETLSYLQLRHDYIVNCMNEHKQKYEFAVSSYEKYLEKKTVGITWYGVLHSVYDGLIYPALKEIGNSLQLLMSSLYQSLLDIPTQICDHLAFMFGFLPPGIGCSSSYTASIAAHVYHLHPFSSIILRLNSADCTIYPQFNAWKYFSKWILKIADVYVISSYY